MPQSLAKIYIHITFSTKNREPFIIKQIQPELYAYIGEICDLLECYPIKIGGFTDHIHILCLLSKKIALMKLLEEVKKSSSKWIKTKGSAFEAFYWQNGYGAFSVNPTQVDAVANYIKNQEAHHKNKDFKDEFRGFLRKYNVEFDEQFVWD